MCKNAFDEIRKLSQYPGLGQSQNIAPRQDFIRQLAAGVIGVDQSLASLKAP